MEGKGGLELPLLYEDADALDDGVLLVLGGIVLAFEVDTEEASEALPEGGAEGAQEGFEDVVAALVGLALDEFDEHAGLVFGKALQRGLVLVEYLTLHLFEVAFALLLGGESLYVFVCLEQCLADKFGVREGLLDVAHGAPEKFLLLFILELQFGEDRDVVEHYDHHRVPLLGDLVVATSEHGLHAGAGTVYGFAGLHESLAVGSPLNGLSLGLFQRHSMAREADAGGGRHKGHRRQKTHHYVVNHLSHIRI